MIPLGSPSSARYRSVRLPPTISGASFSIASRTTPSAGPDDRRGLLDGRSPTGLQQGVARATLRSGKAKVATPQPSIAETSRVGLIAKAAPPRPDTRPGRDGRRASSHRATSPSTWPAGSSPKCCPSICADGAGFLAVVSQARRGQRIERYPLGATGQDRLATPARRYIPLIVWTWMSSPEWELAMIASSGGVSSNASTPPASMRASRPNGFTQERRVTIRSGSPSSRMIRPRRRLDDVAAVDRLDDPVPDLADEDDGAPRRSGR